MANTTAALHSGSVPLAVRMRPKSLDEVAGQKHLLKPGSPLVSLATSKSGDKGSVSVILWGPPGTGKTTIAQSIAHSSGRRFVELSAVSAGVKDVRQVMDEAMTSRDLYGLSTVLFLDEIHRFTKAQQDALLPGVENGWVILVAATTENPSFSVISPLLSRSLLLTLEQLTDDDLRIVLDRAIEDPRGLGGRFDVTDDARDTIIRLASGDARRALTALEAASVSADSLDAGESADDDRNTADLDPDNDDDESPDDDDEESEDSPGSATSRAHAPAAERRPVITADIVSSAVDRALLRYDRNGDEHYDVISAFIKSIRGSDVDAALHYLARMIEAGEDPRFISRRIIVSAAEDIGMADPNALVIAVAAADSVQFIGMPEGRIPLAEAVVYLATAAKSNASYVAIDRAIADVRAGKFGRVPKPMRDAHYAGAKRLGHGKGYRYPHDADVGVVEQQYLPDELQGVRYYQPTQHGNERDVSSRLAKLLRIVRGGRV
ncbi:replication-associated recombination protein A [Mycetocola manganoxydans]|uniref:Replication-associated recombination protein A n=1 Tax=Mycetocola manganoxydans TaxID=699879 RepID=A0A3L6ZYM9_9MICO|nr:replication-associated recombination protein A [Mycetocola manganoxydans]RLP72541.1 replication-associated recombination protein A [Mycetocola manganoxydans]GHD39807.1 ATPase AAA [Mycetocola manganoxydans]